MLFSVDLKHIEQAEKELDGTFPEEFQAKTVKENSKEAGIDSESWTLFPFFDQTNSNRMSETRNQIALETKNARAWNSFPQNAVAIGENGYGDYLLLQPTHSFTNHLSETPYSWRHETRGFHKVGNTIADLLEPNYE